MGRDPESTLHDLVRYYESYGSLILKVYAEAHQAPGVPELAARGRAYHVDWCRQAFAGALGSVKDAATRERRLAQVVALCDATTWRPGASSGTTAGSLRSRRRRHWWS